MASLGKILVFSGEDYAYWKVRMRAFLQSMGAEVGDITKNQVYEVLAISDLSSSGVRARGQRQGCQCLVRWRFSCVVLTRPGFSGSPQGLDVS